MHSRLIPAVLSGIALTAAFGLYRWTVVPLIELPNLQDRQLLLHDAGKEAGRGICDPELLASYFHPDHWIHRRPPKVFETNQVMLLFADNDSTAEGRITLKPCALLFFPHPRIPNAPPPPDAVILEAPDGAIVQLDGGLRPEQGEFGHLKNGELKGAVTIRSQLQDGNMITPLVIQASNVQINDRRIWSNSDISFQFGSNHGRGKDLEIRFLPLSTEGNSDPDAPDAGIVQSVEIIRDVDVTFQLANQKFFDNSNSPIRVTCNGSFYFNIENRIAEFDKNVRVVRVNQNGPADQMTCQELNIRFAQRDILNNHAGRDLNKAAAANIPGMNDLTLPFPRIGQWDLEPTQLEAFGAPVLVDIHSKGAHIQCEELTYEIAEQRLMLKSLTSAHDVVFQWEQSNYRLDIQCPIVSYRLNSAAPRDRIGTLDATGPGQLVVAEKSPKADTAPDSMGSFTASWAGEVHLTEQNGQPVLSVFGSPHLALSGLGELTSDELHLWLIEPLPRDRPDGSADKNHQAIPQSEKTPILPDRLAAIGNVVVNSPRLTAQSTELQVWFRHIDSATVLTYLESDGNAMTSEGTAENPSEPWLNRKLHHGRAYGMAADLIQLEINVTGMAQRSQVVADVKNLTATGKVRFYERAGNTTDRSPLELHGYRLHVRDADSPAAFISLSGCPDGQSSDALASVAAQGASLRGQHIRLDRAANRLWINSPGELTLPVHRDFSGQPLTQPEHITIAWDQGMDFNGQIAIFAGNILAHGAGAWLRTGKMTAQLADAISFEMKTADRPDVQRLVCDGDVVIDRREMDASGQIGEEHFEVASLDLEWNTGAIRGGPGWIKSVRYADTMNISPIASRSTTPPLVEWGQSTNHATDSRQRGTALHPGSFVDASSRLRYLRVDFQRSMEGNLKQRQMTVHGQVHAIYGPVDSWEQTIEVHGPGWNKGALALDCEHLTVFQRLAGARGREWIELTAHENVEIKGITPRHGAFNAQAQRLTYDQRKDLLVLDGGPNGARLWREQSAGLPLGNSSFGKIMYWPSRNEVSAKNVRSAEFQPAPNP
ncbi:MAG: hypothetical protein JW829_18870 [Pirellulales bacterium]|nr:hypothetical protein [Pirellulales bacterium]